MSTKTTPRPPSTTSSRIPIPLILSVLVIAFISIYLRTWFSIPVARVFPIPERTSWRPVGPPVVGNVSYLIIPEPDTMHTMHADINNQDYIWGVAAPVFEHLWDAENDKYVPEGPTLDNAGNLYFSPFRPREPVSLICLDAHTGKRRWALTDPTGFSGGGAPLILNNPDIPGTQLVYHATYEHAWSLRPNGSVVWHTPTGLRVPPTPLPGQPEYTHVWGMSYHPQTDTVLGLTGNGTMFAMDRRTGRMVLRSLLQLPGSPSRNPNTVKPRQWVIDRGDAETDVTFGRRYGRGTVSVVIDAIFGDSTAVANFYCVDPNSGRIYVAATAPDDHDGVVDGRSQDGALYLIEMVQDDTPDDDLNPMYRLEIIKFFGFSGGTGSTPTMSPDSTRMLVSDDANHVIALNSDLRELWRLDVKDQVVASLAYSPDNQEIYGVTRKDIIKILDHGTWGEEVWRAKLDVYSGCDNVNALTPLVTANGIAVSVAASKSLPFGIGTGQIMFRVGMALLDRETGHIRYFSEGREESIAVTVVGQDGGYYQALSPIRRAIARGLLGGILGDDLPPIIGGISYYRPKKYDILIRDATCAAAARMENLLSYGAGDHPKSASQDIRQVGVLIRQSMGSLVESRVEEGGLRGEKLERVEEGLKRVEVVLEEGGDAEEIAKKILETLSMLCMEL